MLAGCLAEIDLDFDDEFLSGSSYVRAYNLKTKAK